MALKQIYFGSKEYQQMLNLRYEILRKPLGIAFTPEQLAAEKDDILIGAFDEDELIGCCILTPQNNHTVKLGQMVVQNNLQGKGIGESIITFAENLASDKGFKTIYMYARDSAIGFYEKFGYTVNGDGFIIVNTPHHLMEKKLV
jgi:predicted GNAT family N-acyltransferase